MRLQIPVQQLSNTVEQQAKFQPGFCARARRLGGGRDLLQFFLGREVSLHRLGGNQIVCRYRPNHRQSKDAKNRPPHSDGWWACWYASAPGWRGIKAASEAVRFPNP